MPLQRTLVLFASLTSLLLYAPLGGVWYLYAVSCTWPSSSTDSIRALVISDAHILGERKRSALDVSFTDWSLRSSYAIITAQFTPDIVLNIGDVLDEGTRANLSQYASYMQRARNIFLRGSPNLSPTSTTTSTTTSATSTTSTTSTSTSLTSSASFSTKTLTHYAVMGNHDVGWRHLVDHRLASFEHDHNSPNGFFKVKNLMFARINSMALHPDAIRTPGGLKHRREIESMLYSRTHVDVLLTHMPLYRPNDLRCGKERALDAINGGVTYYPSNKMLVPDDDVVNEPFTKQILEQWTPTNVLSGHLHSVCRFDHESGTRELTIPTFSWRMRPDPKYFLISFETNGRMQATECPLPNEHWFMASIGVWIVFILVLTLLECRHRWPGTSQVALRKHT
jgi:hypothetical protein